MEDIFDKLQAIVGISKYSSSEIPTPKWVVTDMVDMFANEDKTIFRPDAKFLDPAVKSGRFLAEIYSRLMVSPLMVTAFPNEQDRHEHILRNQLFGVATSPTAATIVRKQLYNDPTIAGNIVYTADKVTKELIQGAFSIMKFDVVIGNPPYNKGMDLDFVDMGFELSKQYTVMITPAKWQTADANQGVASKNMTYGKFREKLVPHMSHVVFYPDTHDVFLISQVDGITYADTAVIDLSDETASLYFANPSKSDKDMVLQIVIQDEVIVQSGRITAGHEVTLLNLMDGASEKLSLGGYNAKFMVFYYNTETGAKEVVNTEIPITVTVIN